MDGCGSGLCPMVGFAVSSKFCLVTDAHAESNYFFLCGNEISATDTITAHNLSGIS
jgi:hypothetical protein